MRDLDLSLGEQLRHQGVILIIVPVPNLRDAGRREDLRAIDARKVCHVTDRILKGDPALGRIRHSVLFGMHRRELMPVADVRIMRRTGQEAVIAGSHESVWVLPGRNNDTAYM